MPVGGVPLDALQPNYTAWTLLGHAVVRIQECGKCDVKAV
jgi:hypothetical protein